MNEPAPAVLKACLAEEGLIGDPAVRAPLHAPRPESVTAALAAYRALPACPGDAPSALGGV